ncbi:MAG: type II toxin-antitoxin system RelE/ParE family toxin [Planctomycetes bacterium]|nr:type II toxin-antitoxin system RelE/ParE family toxin [Planctomycetota bacterium]
MATKLIIAPEVEQDLAEAAIWYEARRAGLGEEFLSCIDACIAAVLRMPETQAVVHEQYRRVLARRFPYAVFYKYAAGVVTVYAVFHCSRDPSKWRQRLP